MLDARVLRTQERGRKERKESVNDNRRMKGAKDTTPHIKRDGSLCGTIEVMIEGVGERGL